MRCMARKRGRRGRGSTYYDKANDTWVAVVSTGTADGKRRRHKARAKDEDDADVQLARLLRATHAGVDPAKGTLDHYMRDWLADVRSTVRPPTYVSYAGHNRLHISPLLGGIPIVRLRPSDVRRLKADRLAADLSAATVGRILTTLRIALNQAVRDRLLPDNPATAVPLPRVEREPVEALTEERAQQVVDVVQGSLIDNLVVLLLGSGMRVGEALGLDWRDVDLEQGFVIVRRSKSQVRAVPVSDDAVEALRAEMGKTARYGPDEPVFLGERRSRKTRQIERLRPDTVTHLFPRLLEQAGLPRMRIHDLRHGVATLLVARGAHMRVIAEPLGHRNPSLTAKTYAHVVPESQREAVGLLNRKRRTG